MLKQDENNRYQSWKHCYEAFGDITKDNDYLALHLGFYLASWGMYRGSTGLLQKDYKIHIGAVKIVKEYHKDLRCSQNLEVSINNIYAIINLKEELFNHYNQYKYQTKENTFEPKKRGSNKRQKDSFEPLCPALLRRLDSNQGPID